MRRLNRLLSMLVVFAVIMASMPVNVLSETMDDVGINSINVLAEGEPTETPTTEPTDAATTEPTDAATTEPTDAATTEPTDVATPEPTDAATPEPTDAAAPEPTDAATPEPTDAAAPEPTDAATPEPTDAATPEPTDAVTPEPTDAATPEPTDAATPEPTETPVPTPIPLVFDIDGETDVTYDGETHELKAKLVTGELADGDDFEPDSLKICEGKDADSYQVVVDNVDIRIVDAQGVDITDNNKYSIDISALENKVLKISKKEITVTYSGEKVYGDADGNLTFVAAAGDGVTLGEATKDDDGKYIIPITLDGKDTPDDYIRCTAERESGESANEEGYKVTLNGDPADNYSVTWEPGKYVINRRNIVLICSGGKIYGEEDEDLEFGLPADEKDVTLGKVENTNGVYSIPVILNGKEDGRITFTADRTLGETVGSYDISVDNTENQGNYSVTIEVGKYVISEREISIALNEKTKTYGDQDPVYDTKDSWSVENVELTGVGIDTKTGEYVLTVQTPNNLEDTIRCSVSRGSKEDVADEGYAVSLFGDNIQSGYAITYKDSTLIINHRPVVISLAEEKTYGDEDPAFDNKDSWDVVGTNVTLEKVEKSIEDGKYVLKLKSGDLPSTEVEVELKRNEGEDVLRDAGNNVTSYGFDFVKFDSNNYAPDKGDFKFTINPRPIKIGLAESKTYGDEDPTFDNKDRWDVGDEKVEIESIDAANAENGQYVLYLKVKDKELVSTVNCTLKREAGENVNDENGQPKTYGFFDVKLASNNYAPTEGSFTFTIGPRELGELKLEQVPGDKRFTFKATLANVVESDLDVDLEWIACNQNGSTAVVKEGLSFDKKNSCGTKTIVFTELFGIGDVQAEEEYHGKELLVSLGDISSNYRLPEGEETLETKTTCDFHNSGATVKFANRDKTGSIHFAEDSDINNSKDSLITITLENGLSCTINRGKDATFDINWKENNLIHSDSSGKNVGTFDDMYGNPGTVGAIISKSKVAVPLEIDGPEYYGASDRRTHVTGKGCAYEPVNIHITGPDEMSFTSVIAGSDEWSASQSNFFSETRQKLRIDGIYTATVTYDDVIGPDGNSSASMTFCVDTKVDPAVLTMIPYTYGGKVVIAGITEPEASASVSMNGEILAKNVKPDEFGRFQLIADINKDKITENDSWSVTIVDAAGNELTIPVDKPASCMEFDAFIVSLGAWITEEENKEEWQMATPVNIGDQQAALLLGGLYQVGALNINRSESSLRVDMETDDSIITNDMRVTMMAFDHKPTLDEIRNGQGWIVNPGETMTVNGISEDTTLYLVTSATTVIDDLDEALLKDVGDETTVALKAPFDFENSQLYRMANQ